MTTFYGYSKCSTCRKAKQYLQKRGVPFEEIEITTAPPPKSLLAAIVRSGEYALGELFNRSGELYRTMKIKDRIKTSTESELLSLLARHGKLIKRPIVTDGARHTVGFDEARMKRVWG